MGEQVSEVIAAFVIALIARTHLRERRIWDHQVREVHSVSVTGGGVCSIIAGYVV